MSVSLSQEIAPLLPYLRRYARALAGTQKSGDAYVRACLQALVADQSIIDTSIGVKIALYRLFHVLWNATVIPPAGDDGSVSIFEQTAQQRLGSMAPESRQTLLLTTLEGFSLSETARIIDRSEEEVTRLVSAAIEEIDRQTKTDVLIIEDEPLISMDLIEIVESLGHNVTTVARTAGDAIAAAKVQTPGLVLADIQLADGSSGIDAVKEILSELTVPVIFITSFPERLLTGERPEPTFLITKPFNPNTVKAGISQALFFNGADAVAA
ncbi:response regulator receiver domain-containing protein [Roseibium marinum]|uniref:Response regulator receiver domain-containing protein n=1 Tax=Roseibium marinum TaxID=281252 RepID=A0A2S3UL54_9HYPH|nr:response regulator receiver domain-containing protein [Roseibium marinum]